MEQLIAAGVDQETAEQDAHQIEHAISDILLLQLKIGKHRTAEKIGYKLGLMLQFPHE